MLHLLRACFTVAALLAVADPASAQEAPAHHDGSATVTPTHTTLVTGPTTANLIFTVSDSRTVPDMGRGVGLLGLYRHLR